ncbi:MAG: LPS assembly protein LptD, partial [Acidobacteriota bacterium]
MGRSAPNMLSRVLIAVAFNVLATPFAAAQTPTGSGQQTPTGLPFDIPGLDLKETHYDGISLGAGTITFSGYVDLDNSPEWRLQADEVTVTFPEDPDAEAADYYFEATGNVTMDAGEVHINGTRMTGNLRAGTGVVENAWGIGPGEVYFRGDTIEQREAGVYHIEHGIVTPCTQALPIWEFTARSFDLFADDHVTMKVPVFKIKGVPLVVLPALYWPINEDRRSTGLLLPSIGSSNRKGFMYSQPFFWAINRSMDATLTYDYYAKAGSGFSAEYRHALTAQSTGNARFFWLQGSDFTQEEIDAGAVQIPGGWTLDGAHIHNLGRGWRVNANASFFSDRQFIQSFEDNFNRYLRRNSSVGLFVTRSWSSYTLNLVGDNNRTYFSGNESVVQRRVPEVEFRIRRRPIWEPLYYQFQGSYDGLLREERDADGLTTGGGRYQRIDAFPEVSLAFTQIPWLTFNPFLSWRSTWYSQRQDGSEFIDEPIFRNVYSTGVEVIGPSLFRIFDTPSNGYSPRFKHVLEPRFTWGRLQELEGDFVRRNIIQFDEIDRFGGDRHFARASLTNRVLAKRFNSPQDEQRTVWEVFSVELARDFDLNQDPDEVYPSIPLPWSISARVTPTPVINFSGIIRFTPQWRPGGFTISGGARSTNSFVNVTWFHNAITFPDVDDPSIVDVEATDRMTGGGRYNLFRRLITVQGNMTWDVTNKLLQAYMVGATWNTQCCSIGG